MNEHKQPEALRLAELLENWRDANVSVLLVAAAELRRLYHEVAKLKIALLDMTLDYKESMTKWSDD